MQIDDSIIEIGNEGEGFYDLTLEENIQDNLSTLPD
jgi:hypothetical protein